MKELNFKKLYALAQTQKTRLFWGMVFLAISSATTLGAPQAVKMVIDNAVGAKDLKLVDQAAILVFILLVIQGVTSSLRYYLFTTAGERVVRDLRQKLFEKIISQDIAFFDTRKSGEISSRLSSDTTVLQNAVSVNVSMLIRNFASSVGGLALLIYTSPKLTLSMLAVVPPIALGAGILGKKIRELSKNAQDALAKASGISQEALSGIRTVQSFAKESKEASRYKEALNDSLIITTKRIQVIANFMGVASTIGYVGLGFVLWFGGRMVVNNELTLGTLTSFLMYMLFVAFSVGALGGLWTDFMSASGASKRVFELLERTPDLKEGSKKIPALRGEVHLSGVSFSYPARPDVTVLENINLKIEIGKVVALVGPSGSGKSTIAALIPRFYDPTSGAVFLDGINIKDCTFASFRTHIGIVAQEPVLFSTSIKENIMYGRPNATESEVYEAARAANAIEFINRLPEKFETLVGERGVQLSGGQRQRIAIARALLSNPKILILDEATSALDAESEHLVKEALDRLMVGRTTLVIAHRLSTVRDADQVVVLENGRIVQSDTHDNLMKSSQGLYARLVARQFS